MSSTFQKIYGIYDKNPKLWEEFNSKEHENGLGYYLNFLYKDPLSDFNTDTLDKYKYKEELAIVVGHLPIDRICEEFGEQVLIWSWFNYPLFDFYRKEKDRLGKAVVKIIGKDEDKLLNAKDCIKYFLDKTDLSLVLRLYELKENAGNGLADKIDLAGLLKKHKKREVNEISDKRAKDYSLDFLETESRGGVGWGKNWYHKKIPYKIDGEKFIKDFSIYMDAPVGFSLSYKNLPNAVVSFFPTSIDTLMIHQLQGVRPKICDVNGKKVDMGSSRGLVPLEWETLLVEIGEVVAKELNFNEIAIRSAYNNDYVKKEELALGIPLRGGLRRYDKLAKSLGYIQRKDKNWYKVI